MIVLPRSLPCRPGTFRRRSFVCLLVTLLVGLLLPAAQAAAGLLKVHMVTVGDGRNDCFIVELPNSQRMVIDCMDSGVLTNKLNALGITSIKYLVGTHKHSDHIGGMNNFLNSGFTINNTVMYYPKGSVNASGDDYNWMVNAANARSMTVQKLVQNDYILNTTYNGQELSIRVLSPVDWRVNGGSNDYTDANDASLVLKVRYGSKAIIFMGDAREPTETDMINTVSSALWAQVLKVGHHGIRHNLTYGASDAFLDRLGATKALVTNGTHDIGLPIVYNLQERNISYWSTGQYGATVGDVCLTTDGSSDWSADSPPYWQPGATGTTYQLCTHKASGELLHSTGGDVSFVGPEWTGYNNRWRLIDAGGGYYYIKHMTSGKLLYAPASGTDVSLGSSADTSDNVKWQLVDIDGTWKHLDHKSSGMRLHASSAEAWLVRLTSKTYTGDNVRWKLTVVPLGS